MEPNQTRKAPGTRESIPSPYEKRIKDLEDLTQTNVRQIMTLMEALNKLNQKVIDLQRQVG